MNNNTFNVLHINTNVAYVIKNDGEKYYNEELNEAMAKETVKGRAKVKTRR